MKLLVMGAGLAPEETFINRRLQALMHVGVEVIVAGEATPRQLRGPTGPGITYIGYFSKTPIKTLATVLYQGTRMILPRWNQVVGLISFLVHMRGGFGNFAYRLATGLMVIKVQPDIIHFEWNSAAIHNEWMMDFFQIPTVISVRGRQVNIWPLLPQNESFRASLVRTLQKAAAVHCVSKDILQVAVRLGLPPEKGCVIYTAVDTEFFAPVATPIPTEEPLRILMVGALIWRKGYIFALMALRQLIDWGYNVRLDVIGEGPDLEQLMFTMYDLHLQNNVSFLGGKAQAEVRDALQSAQLFMHTSLSEGLANVVVEAMACGLPVVIADCGGMREALHNGVEGFLVPRRDALATASAVEKLCTDRELRERMGKAGRKRVLEQFGLKIQAGQFSQLYETLIHDKKNHRINRMVRSDMPVP